MQTLIDARIGDEALPSDFILRQLQLPVFHLLFQLMIFSALSINSKQPK